MPDSIIGAFPPVSSHPCNDTSDWWDMPIFMRVAAGAEGGILKLLGVQGTGSSPSETAKSLGCKSRSLVPKFVVFVSS